MIEAVMFDFGGVIADGPFDAFDRYEKLAGLAAGFIRRLNSTNHHENAWARYERSEIDFDAFCEAFEAEAKEAGGSLDTRELFAMLSGSLRPAMVEAVRRCADRFKTALLTNNFVAPDASTARRRSDHVEVFELFDVVIESSVAGVRKPDPRFYALACETLDVAPEQAVFLDDLGVNLKPARAMGMLTIKVEETDKAIAELESVVGIPLR
jgi:putative hydrolase of the HAD superfamily